jgi:mRNA interferase HigB
VKVISIAILRSFWERADCRAAEQPLKAWYKEVEKAEWETTADVKALYRSADLVPEDRVVFNIGGNKFRLVVWVKLTLKLVLIKWVGTHGEYDRIDVTTIGLPKRTEAKQRDEKAKQRKRKGPSKK